MTARRVVGIVVGLLVLFYIVSAPASAAALVREVLAILGGVADSIIVFLQSLF